MNPNQRLNRDNRFEFAGEAPQHEDPQQASKNYPPMDPNAQNQEIPQRTRMGAHALPENPNQEIPMTNPKIQYRAEMEQRGGPQELPRHPSQMDMQSQMREMNRHHEERFQGRPSRGSLPMEHAPNMQMEMMHAKNERPGHGYYQGQGYQGGHPMGPMRGEMPMPGMYRHAPGPKSEMYGQMEYGRGYPPGQGYGNPQMGGGYYENPEMQGNPRVNQETLEKISNLEKVYFDVLNERVKIKTVNGQWMAHFRGGNVPIHQMNEYITKMQQREQHQPMHRGEYYGQPQGHQEYHVDPLHLNPGYEDPQMGLAYAYNGQGRFDFSGYQPSTRPTNPKTRSTTCRWGRRRARSPWATRPTTRSSASTSARPRGRPARSGACCPR